jgi:hypothetical protein
MYQNLLLTDFAAYHIAKLASNCPGSPPQACLTKQVFDRGQTLHGSRVLLLREWVTHKIYLGPFLLCPHCLANQKKEKKKDWIFNYRYIWTGLMTFPVTIIRFPSYTHSCHVSFFLFLLEQCKASKCLLLWHFLLS